MGFAAAATDSTTSPPRPGTDTETETDTVVQLPGIEVPSRPAHLSPSGASLYQQCPRRWKHRYVDRLPDPPGVAALAGTFAHRVLELLLQEPDQRRTVERAKELARVAWPEIATDDDFAALGLDETELREFRWRGWLAVEGLWAIEDPCTVSVDATEHDVQVLVGDVPFRGVVDRIDLTDDGRVITDYKSGRAPAERFAAGRLTQVMLYAAAVAATTGERPIRARLLYLGQKIVEIDVTDENLESAVGELEATWSSLTADCDRGVFEATTGPLCGWCPYVDRCPEGRAEVNERVDSGRLRLDAPAIELIARSA